MRFRCDLIVAFRKIYTRAYDSQNPLRIALTIGLTIILGQSLTSQVFADDDIPDIKVECGNVPPKGVMQNNGRFHREVSGKSFETTYPGTSVHRTLQERFAKLKGTKCWIRYLIDNPAHPVSRSTGTFQEVYISTQLFPQRDDMGELLALTNGSLDPFITYVSQDAATCGKEFEPYRELYNSSNFGPNYSEAKARIYEAAKKRYSECMSREAERLDELGFVGVWSPNDGFTRGFAWLSGKLYKFEY